MPDYIDVVYNVENRPKTDYPDKLATYLFKKFEMKKGEKILEPGCGRGEFLSGFRKMGMDVYGCDLSPQAGEDLDGIEIKQTDIENNSLPYDDDYFDVVYSKSLLEHLWKPDHYFREAKRILKPGGKILTLVPDWEANYKIYFDDYTHRTPFTKISLYDIHQICNYESVRVIKFRQLPIVWKLPILNPFCALISLFVPVRSTNKFLRWSKELMLIGYGRKAI
jgi:SAM-dependent methyltransferase